MTNGSSARYPKAIIGMSIATALSAFIASSVIAAGDDITEPQGDVTPTADVQSGDAQPTEAVAETPALSMEGIIAKVKEQGYADISKIEREGDRYEVRAKDDDGKKVELYVDAQTGNVIPAAEKALSMEDVITKVKEQGYPEISEIEREGDRYWMMARDAEGKKVELHVDAKTGKVVSKEREGM